MWHKSKLLFLDRHHQLFLEIHLINMDKFIGIGFFAVLAGKLSWKMCPEGI